MSVLTPVASDWVSVSTGVASGPQLPPLPTEESIPRTWGKAAPSGVADLLVVKQQLARYEAAEVAHIENVLKGREQGARASRRRETEELTFRETEITTSEERELESTTASK